MGIFEYNQSECFGVAYLYLMLHRAQILITLVLIAFHASFTYMSVHLQLCSYTCSHRLVPVMTITVDISDYHFLLTMACAVVITLLFCQEVHSPKLFIPTARSWQSGK